MYATRLALQNAIIAEAVREGDATFAGLCAEFITRAERRMFQGLRPLKAREMETRVTLTITAGVGATPTGFLSARRLTWVADVPYKLNYCHPEDFYDRTGLYSRPTIFTIDGTVINVLSPASGTATLSYYAQPSALSGDSDTNTTLVAHGHVYLAAALIEAYGFLDNEPKMMLWTQKFFEAVDGVNLAAVKARYAGTHLSPRVPGAV
jgi:hypothetical protein